MPDNLIVENQVDIWLKSGDSFLVSLAENCLNQPLPKEQELTDFLTFLSIFSLGCKEFGLEEISKKYEKRISLFTRGLAEMGCSRGFRHEYVANRKVPGLLSRISRKAFGKATYNMLELKRDFCVENKNIYNVNVNKTNNGLKRKE